MKTKTLLVVLFYNIWIKLCEARVIGVKHNTPLSSEILPGPNPMLSAPSSPFERLAPKCYPETATAYFLPAPPSAPKVTVLDSNWKEFLSFNSNTPLPETPSSFPLNIISNRADLEPPCSPSAVLPDLIDEVPVLIQDRFSRLVGTDVKTCETCSKLMEKLPIFNFDRELLNGFLSGLGMKS